MGAISFQNDVYGTVGTATETFGPGEYDITLQHGGSNICHDRDGDGAIDNQSGRWCDGCDPDYDYEARVSKVGGDAEVTIVDNQRTYVSLQIKNHDVDINKLSRSIGNWRVFMQSKLRWTCLWH